VGTVGRRELEQAMHPLSVGGRDTEEWPVKIGVPKNPLGFLILFFTRFPVLFFLCPSIFITGMQPCRFLGHGRPAGRGYSITNTLLVETTLMFSSSFAPLFLPSLFSTACHEHKMIFSTLIKDRRVPMVYQVSSLP
jgi:hypothetical protein